MMKQTTVVDFFKKLGIRPAKTNRQFWSDLAVKHNRETVQELSNKLEQQAKDNRWTTEFYELKNKSLALSLDFLSYTADFYRRVFEWYQQNEDKSPKRILDLGCDNGFVSCWLAQEYPEAEVIGIDPVATSVNIAKLLAEKLGLTNVKFEHLTLLDAVDKYGENSFDCIVSIHTLHELIGNLPAVKAWDLTDCLTLELESGVRDKLAYISRLLSTDGRFVSVDKVIYPEHIMLFINTLASLGLMTDWNSSRRINYQKLSDQESIPGFIFHKGMAEALPVDNIYKLYITPNQELVPGFTCGNIEAEYWFKQLHDIKLVKGVQFTFNNGSGVMRTEIWENPELYILYRVSDIGYRELALFCLKDKEKIEQRLALDKFNFFNTAKAQEYISLSEKSELA